MLLEILYSTICIENLQPNYAILPIVGAAIISGVAMLGSAGISFMGNQSASATQQNIADQQYQLQQQMLQAQAEQQKREEALIKNVAIYGGLGLLFIVLLVVIYKSI